LRGRTYVSIRRVGRRHTTTPRRVSVSSRDERRNDARGRLRARNRGANDDGPVRQIGQAWQCLRGVPALSRWASLDAAATDGGVSLALSCLGACGMAGGPVPLGVDDDLAVNLEVGIVDLASDNRRAGPGQVDDGDKERALLLDARIEPLHRLTADLNATSPHPPLPRAKPPFPGTLLSHSCADGVVDVEPSRIWDPTPWVACQPRPPCSLRSIAIRGVDGVGTAQVYGLVQVPTIRLLPESMAPNDDPSRLPTSMS
jgi:hypothetical protein